MSKMSQQVLDEALQLELSERAELAAELLASLDGQPDKDVEVAWVVEIERRTAHTQSDIDAKKP
jgi:hypothetical protein